MQTTFEELKVKLTSAPLLAYPDYGKPFVVCTDASSQAVEAALSQSDENGRDHQTDCAIRALSSSDSNYWAFERKELAVLFALKNFRHYLTSNKSKLYTDYQALEYVLKMKDPHGRIARWFTLPAEYDFEICYRAGRGNACADYLSRPVDWMLIDDNQPYGANLKMIAHY